MTDHMSEILIGAKALHRELERKIADQQAKIAYLKKNNRDWARKTWIALALGFLVTGILIYNELTVHPMPEFMKPFEKCTPNTNPTEPQMAEFAQKSHRITALPQPPKSRFWADSRPRSQFGRHNLVIDKAV